MISNLVASLSNLDKQQKSPFLAVSTKICLLNNWPAAFIDRRTNELSVHIVELTSQETISSAYPEQGIVEIEADDPSHALICPLYDGPIKKSEARKLAQQSRWVLYPLSQR